MHLQQAGYLGGDRRGRRPRISQEYAAMAYLTVSIIGIVDAAP
jgi:hypothetical protein